jgi:hypothetical protein
MISAADQSNWDAILGPYPILPDEDEARYGAILAAAIDHFRPEDFIQYMETREFAEIAWEQQRWRNYANCCVKSGAAKALYELIDVFRGYWGSDSAKATAQDYFGGDPKKREQAAKKLADQKIDDTAIFAKSFQMNSDAIWLLDRMRARREARRARMLKDHERRQANRDKSASRGHARNADQPATRALAS